MLTIFFHITMNLQMGSKHFQIKSHWDPEDKSIEDYVQKAGIVFRW